MKFSAPVVMFWDDCQSGWCRLKSPAIMHGPGGRVWLIRCSRPMPESMQFGLCGALYKLQMVRALVPSVMRMVVRSQQAVSAYGIISTVSWEWRVTYVRVHGRWLQSSTGAYSWKEGCQRESWRVRSLKMYDSCIRKTCIHARRQA